MPTYAGQMDNGVQVNPQWFPAGRQVLYVNDPKQAAPRTVVGVSTGTRRDYWRNVGRQGIRRGLGPLGWIFILPNDPGAAWRVTTADDFPSATLTNAPTVGKPPAGVTA